MLQKCFIPAVKRAVNITFSVMTPAVPAYSAAQVRAAEAPLLAAGVPLMARASAVLADVVADALGGTPSPRILVLAGPGDNGGDALYAAAALADRAEVDVLTVSERFHAEGLAAATAAGARRVGLREAVATGYDLLLDGILGIGTSADPALRGLARTAVEELLPAVRGGRTRVVAVDLPSGLHPDSGAADEAVLPAWVTVTFGAVKTGLVTGRGPELAGEVVLVRIGIDEELSGVVPAGSAVVSRILTPEG